MEFDQARVSVSRNRAAKIADLSTGQMAYWSRTDVVSPTVEVRVTGRSVARLYDYADLMSLLVAAELHERGISLIHIRRVVAHLRGRGYDRPLTQLVFATLKGHIYFQHDDGGWEGDNARDQMVLHEVLDLEPLRARIAAGIRRAPDEVGRVERRSGTLGSKRVFAGTRVPIDTVRRYLAAGRTPDEIVVAFPVLTVADINAAAADVA